MGIMENKKSLGQLKKEQTERLTATIKECKIFFAFSDQQFQESKTELADENDKYVSTGYGGYLPKSCVEKYKTMSAESTDLFLKEIKDNDLVEQHIAYELSNHECFDSHDISDVLDMFDGIYTEEQIRLIFYKKLKDYDGE
jgi:hypothetical protein